MSGNPHPARSLDFLSRLHDGELSPAERAHFESHRAHCAECRKAAAEFEEALAVYRTAGTSAPPSDLAARILRRLESSNRRRAPFGVTFGIDLRWAGAFTAALLAVIFGYAVLGRQEAHKIPVSFAPPPSAPPTVAERLLARETADAPLPHQRAKAETAPRARPEPQASAPGLLLDTVEEKAPAKKELAAAAPPSAQADNLARSTPGPAQMPARSTLETRQAVARPAAVAAASIRVFVTPLDSEGEAPALRNAAEIAFRPEDRGQYVLVVGADGAPLEVSSPDAARDPRAAALSKTAVESLHKLRFQAGDRTRRLLVRVE
jgi:hypothetical protein